jgi:flagellar P-ring protein precursor FlgI
MDVTVSSIGSASDLSGGVLVQTPLKAANDEVYAVAQGSITKGGNNEERHQTTVRIPDGALVEQEVPYEFVGRKDQINLQIKKPDFTTATRVSNAINERFNQQIASPKNGSTVQVQIPKNFRSNPVGFISRIENLEITPAEESRVIVNERTGTVIMGGDVGVRSMSVSHGDITLQVDGEGQPQGESVIIPRSTTVQQIVDSLNEIGASTDTVVAILEAMDKANAIHAPLEVM